VKASRLLSILMLLQARKRLSAPELARALEVSERTILRDIDQLSAAGVPVWGERGRSGGFQLREGWSTQLTGLTEPEVNALFLAGLLGPATELGLGTAAASARLKIVAGLPAEWRAQAERVGARLHIDPIDWYRVQETPRYLREVADAVWAAQAIRMQYESWRGVGAREVHPLGLILKAGAWYLVAQSIPGRRVATYRLANVLELKRLQRTFQRPKAFDLAAYWRQASARFEADLNRVQVRLNVSPRGLKWLANLRLRVLPSPAAPDDGTEWNEVLMWVESIEYGARQLLALGSEVEVLEPISLRQALAQAAQHVSAIYSRDQAVS
jgi:predicted DNA-binding transcriptional regulator YafY